MAPHRHRRTTWRGLPCRYPHSQAGHSPVQPAVSHLTRVDRGRLHASSETGSVKGMPNASATAEYVTLPSTMLSPFSSDAFSARARFQPLLASWMAYGSVALVSASVEVLGTPPGM